MGPSVVDINETEWCRWLFEQHHFTPQLYAKLKVAYPEQVYFSLPTSRLVPTARGPGDIDILVADANRPEATTVIEVKRVKVSEPTFTTLAPTKLKQSADKGVTQANLLGQLRFQRTWLLVIVATDGRARPGANFSSRGITWELQDLICREPSFAHLDPHVGLLFVFFDQPVDKEISMAGGFGFRLEREPANVDQPAELTATVRAALNTPPTPAL